MKKYISRFAVVAGLLIGLSFTGAAQIVVRVRPAAPHMVRSIAPSPRHIWIEGGWAARGHRYVWADGYWTMPRRGHHWIGGRWDRRRGGWCYVPGHWNRRGRW
jgi:hypothetical protein